MRDSKKCHRRTKDNTSRRRWKKIQPPRGESLSMAEKAKRSSVPELCKLTAREEAKSHALAQQLASHGAHRGFLS
jgi:hypothetical protein